MKNKDIEKLHQDLIQLINNYNYLPIGIVYYVMQSCLGEVKQTYQQILGQEIEQEQFQEESSGQKSLTN